MRVDKGQKAHKVRNERLKMARAKDKELKKGLGIDKKKDWDRAVETPYIIDINKQKSHKDEPRFTG